MKHLISLFLIINTIILYGQSGEDLSNPYNAQAQKDNSLEFAFNSLNNCNTIGCRSTEEFIIALIYKKRSQYDSALIHAQKAFFSYKKLRDKEGIKNIQWLVGDILRKSGNHRYAISQYTQALSLNTSTKTEMEIKLDMAKSYQYTSEIDETMRLLNECIEYFDGKDDYRFAHAHMVLGNVISDLQKSTGSPNYERCFDHYFTASKFYKEDGLKAQALNNIGWLLIEENKFQRAKVFLDSAYRIQTDSSELAAIKFNLSILYMKNDNLEEAYKSLIEVIELSDQYTLSLSLGDCYIRLIKYFSRNLEFSKVDYLADELHLKMNSKLFELEKMKSSAIKYIFDTALSDEEIKELRSRNTSNYLYITFIVPLLLGLIGFIVLKKLRPSLINKRKLNDAVKNINDLVN